MIKSRQKFHCLQHVSFEGPGHIAAWAERRGHTMRSTEVYRQEPWPALEDFDWLIVLGGPMSVNDEEAYPWLIDEKDFIRSAVAGGKTVLGICLGAQLIAGALGARVVRNREKEIGWFRTSLTPTASALPAFAGWPPVFFPFHWHSDTFDVPPGSELVATSSACRNQAFIHGDRVVGLQFHLEYTVGGIEQLYLNCNDELIEPGCFVQGASMLADEAAVKAANSLLDILLDNLPAKTL